MPEPEPASEASSRAPVAEASERPAHAPATEEPSAPPAAAAGGHGGGGRRRNRYAGRDLTEGSIPKNLWSLSWPQVVESSLNVADQLMDLVWAGRLGATHLASMGVAQTYVMTGMTGRQGFDVAMRAMISRAVGAGDIARASHVALQSFSLSGLFSVIMALIGVFLTEPLMGLLGVPQDVVSAGADYMRLQFIGMGSTSFRIMTGAALQSSGDAITPMRASLIARVLHLILSPVFIFGLLFVPEMGLAGAAAGNVLAQGVGAGLNFWALFTGKSRLHLTLTDYRPDFPLLWQIVKTGAPASITQAERSIAQLLLIGLVSPYGATTLAAFAVTRRIENLVMMGARGFGQAAGIIAGQCIGARKLPRARQTVAWAVAFVFVINSVTVLFLVLFPTYVIRVFNSDPEMIEVATTWLRIAALGYLFLGVGQVFQQSYNIAGDTLVPMVVTLVSIWLVQQPLALVLPGLGLDQYGIAWAVVIAVLVRLLIYGPYYFHDRWLRVRL